MSNSNQLELKGLGYYISKVEQHIFQILKIFYKLSSNYCIEKYKIILNYFYYLLQENNISKLSKSTLIFTILYLLSKAIYELIKNNKKRKNSKISIKPGVFFPPKEYKKKFITDSEYTLKIVKRGDSWDNLKNLIQQKCKLYKVEEIDLEYINKPFFKIVKAFLKYDEIKNKF